MSNCYRCLLIGSLWLLSVNSVWARDLIVNAPFSEHHRYCYGLLQLALHYLDNKYTLVTRDGAMQAQTREVEDLSDGKVSVIWIATSIDFEEQLLPIRVPLYKGLLGYRVFIIHEGDQNRFDQVHTLADLQAIPLGQGKGWTDTAILQANGLKVITAAKYEGLFHMLDGRRFAAFPRGVHEPWSEIASHPDLELAIEQKLMLTYKMPLYFFVAKGENELATDLEKALHMAIEDGSFDRYFFSNPMIRNVLEKANMGSRRVFELSNPLLPPKTPLGNTKLWFDPSHM